MISFPRNNSYEVIAVDNGSTDNTYKAMIEFARQHSEFKVLKLAMPVNEGTLAMVSGVRTKGRFIFFYTPHEGVQVEDFDIFYEKIVSDEKSMIVGKYKDDDEIVDFKRSSLSLLCEHFMNSILNFNELDNNLRNICYSMMISRETGRNLFLNMKVCRNIYCDLIIASEANIDIKIVELKSKNPFVYNSFEQVLSLLSAFLLSLFYYFRIWSIKTIKVKQSVFQP